MSLTENPKEPEERYVLVGVSFYEPGIFSVLNDLRPGHGGELWIADAIAMAIARGFSVSWSELDGEWVDAGTPEDLFRASCAMRRIYSSVVRFS